MSGLIDKVKEIYHHKNRPVVVSVVIFCLLFIGMSVYMLQFVAEKEEEMINNSYNSRQDILLSRNYRGTILSRDGMILAQTITDSNGNEKRYYPYGKSFAHVIGYDAKGKMGVEGEANYYLINTNISLSSKVSNDVAGVKNPGDNVYTTLDYELQRVCDNQLNIYKGAIVVTDVKTGQVLTMVSHPTFDPNEISAIWDDLMNDNSSSVLLNRVTQGLYPPGSTFKIFTALEFMRQFPDNYDQYKYQCKGRIDHNGTGVECYHGTVHGAVDFTSSFVRSCNSSFANIGMQLDWDAYEETMKGLLFNEKLPAVFPTSQSSFVKPDEENTAMVMQTSFGQGKTLVTPLHLNMLTAAIANDGVLMKPYVVDKVVSAEDSLVKQYNPTKYGTIYTMDEVDELQRIMTAAVTDGSYTKLKNLPYTVAGKTGSAEFSNNKDECHSWFTGYAPADDPEIAVTIIMEGAGTGGDYAVPMAREIFDTYFHNK